MGFIPGLCPGQYAPGGVNFDGSTAYLATAVLGAIADGKNGTLSVWVKFAAGTDGVELPIYASGDNNATTRVYCARASANVFLFSHWGIGSSPTRRVLMETDTALANQFKYTGGWRHLLASWADDGVSPCWVYVDGVAPTMIAGGNGTVLASAGTIAYSDSPYEIGRDPTNTGNKFKGDMAELWFDTSSIDLSVQANREKFIKGGRPVELGDSGQLPTGSQPLVCMRGLSTAFPTNSGSGGSFTTTGSLTDASTSPP